MTYPCRWPKCGCPKSDQLVCDEKRADIAAWNARAFPAEDVAGLVPDGYVNEHGTFKSEPTDRDRMVSSWKPVYSHDAITRLAAELAIEKERVAKAAARIAEISTERDTNAKDAERYRWLRVRNEAYNPVDLHGPYVCVETGDSTIYPDAAHLDAAIDAALAGAKA